MTRLLRRFARWLMRLLLRVGLLPARTRAETDTMGEYKRLLAEKDDPRPGLVPPDPNAPHADLIRRVRLYAQNGAKALAPLLDSPWPTLDGGGTADAAKLHQSVQACIDAGKGDEHPALLEILDAIALRGPDTLSAIHAAYNAPWTVVDGEVYEYETEKRKRVVQ